MGRSAYQIEQLQKAADQYRTDFEAFKAATKKKDLSAEYLEEQLMSFSESRRDVLISALENGFRVEINE